MAKRALLDSKRVLIALHAAAYTRWVETRKGASPSADDTQRFIRDLLDGGGMSYEADEPQTIEILALVLNLDAVHAFIKKNGIFEKLDHAANRRNSN